MRTTPGSLPPLQAAREAAGLTLERAARLLGVTPQHLRHRELHGGAGERLCQRISRLYGCPREMAFHSPQYLADLAEYRSGWEGGAPERALSPSPAGGADTLSLPLRRRVRAARRN